MWDYDQVRVRGIERRTILRKVHLNDVVLASFQWEAANLLEDIIVREYATTIIWNGAPLHDPPIVPYRPVRANYRIILFAILLIEGARGNSDHAHHSAKRQRLFELKHNVVPLRVLRHRKFRRSDLPRCE